MGTPASRVALGVAVPVGVENDAVSVEVGAVNGVQRRDAGNPLAVAERQAERGDGGAAIGVAPIRGEQFQLGDRARREPGADALLLGDDQLGGGLGDGQASSEAVGLVVVEDQHSQAVLVAGQAVEGEVADLLGPSAGVDRQLDAASHLG